jgi:drug/metabolite transporter (DMT)-like permease
LAPAQQRRWSRTRRQRKPLSATSPVGTLVLLSCVAIWGVNAVAFKVGARIFDPILLNGLRFLLVAPIIVGIVWARDRSAFRVQGWPDIARYAVFGLVSVALSETLMALAVQHTSVANMTLLGPGTIALWVALWAVALREQTLTRAGWIGAFVAMAGVGIVAASGPHGFRLDAGSIKGDAIALARSIVHGLYLLFLTRALRERPVLTVTVYNVLFGALWLLPYVLWRAPHSPGPTCPSNAWLALAWTVLPTTVYGFLAWNWGMRQVGAVASTNLFYLLPVFGALAGRLLLGEPFMPGQALGGLIVIGGIVLLRWDTLAQAGLNVRLPWRPRVRD